MQYHAHKNVKYKNLIFYNYFFKTLNQKKRDGKSQHSKKNIFNIQQYLKTTKRLNN